MQLTNTFSVQCKLTVVPHANSFIARFAPNRDLHIQTIDRHSHKRNYVDISHSVPIQVFPISSPVTAHAFHSPPVVSVGMDPSVVENM